SVMTNDVLISVPLFVFMGYIVERANILDRLFRSIQLAAGALPGSLAVATLLTCALFATATGIVGAVVTLMGLLAFPQMLKAGYDVRLASGVTCAGGCLGILIPPSILLIVYGAQAGVSTVKLYAAAIIKDFVLGLNLSPVVFMILAQVIIFILGWPLEWTEIIIIFVPIFLPLLPHFGIDPITFGILVAINLQTAFLSPPMAMACF